MWDRRQGNLNDIGLILNCFYFNLLFTFTFQSCSESGTGQSEQGTNVLNSGRESPDGAQAKDEQKDGEN